MCEEMPQEGHEANVGPGVAVGRLPHSATIFSTLLTSGRALMPLLARTLSLTLTSPMARSSSSTLTSSSSMTSKTRLSVSHSSQSILGILPTTTNPRSRSPSVRPKSKKQLKTLSLSSPNLPHSKVQPTQCRRINSQNIESTSL